MTTAIIITAAILKATVVLVLPTVTIAAVLVIGGAGQRITDWLGVRE